MADHGHTQRRPTRAVAAAATAAAAAVVHDTITMMTCIQIPPVLRWVQMPENVHESGRPLASHLAPDPFLVPRLTRGYNSRPDVSLKRFYLTIPSWNSK